MHKNANGVYVNKMTTESEVCTPANLGKMKFDPEYAKEMEDVVGG